MNDLQTRTTELRQKIIALQSLNRHLLLALLCAHIALIALIVIGGAA